MLKAFPGRGIFTMHFAPWKISTDFSPDVQDCIAVYPPGAQRLSCGLFLNTLGICLLHFGWIAGISCYRIFRRHGLHLVTPDISPVSYPPRTLAIMLTDTLLKATYSRWPEIPKLHLSIPAAGGNEVTAGKWFHAFYWFVMPADYGFRTCGQIKPTRIP